MCGRQHFSLCLSNQPTNKVWFSGVLFDRFGWLAKNTLTFLRIGSNLSFGDTHCTNRPFEKRISRFVYLNQRETVLSFSVADEKHLIQTNPLVVVGVGCFFVLLYTKNNFVMES